MAKMTEEQKQAKKMETARIIKAFKEMPIEQWEEYIDTNAPASNEAKNRQYRVCAKKALTVDNMVAYIKKFDNTAKAKKAFKEGSYGVQYQKKTVMTKNGKSKKDFVLDDNRNKIPVLDEDGNEVKEQSIVYAVDYFTTHYLDGLLVIEEKAKKNAFDAIKNW